MPRSRLPSEIIARILEAMCEAKEPWMDQAPPFGPPMPYRALRRCALVNKDFYSLATPLLYRHLRIGLRYGRDCGHVVTDCIGLEDELLMRPGLGSLTTTIKLYDDRGRDGARTDRRDGGQWMRHSIVKLLASLLACCPNVRGVGLMIPPPALAGIAFWLGSKHPAIDALVLRCETWTVDDLKSTLEHLPRLRVLLLQGSMARRQRQLDIEVSLSSLSLSDRACDALPLFFAQSAHSLRRLDIDVCGRGWRADFNLGRFDQLSEASITLNRVADLQRAIDSLSDCLVLTRLRLELLDDFARPSELLNVNLSPIPLRVEMVDLLGVPLPFTPIFLFILSRPPRTAGCLKFSKKSWTKREKRGLQEWVKLARQAISEGKSFAFM